MTHLSQVFVQEIVSQVCTELLGLNRMNINDDFFQLGGHSLLAMQVISRLISTFHGQFGQRADEVEAMLLNAIFEQRTVAALTRVIVEVCQAERVHSLSQMQPTTRDQPIPLSYSQRLWWFAEQLQPDTPHFHVTNAISLIGPLNIIALEKSLSEVIRRHEALRTAFVATDGVPAQTVCPELPISLSIIDPSLLEESSCESEVECLVNAYAQQPFDLSETPLLRAILIHIDEGKHMLLLVLHHIITDGWSMGVFFRELSILYRAYSEDRPSPLPSLSAQYVDFTLWQQQYLQGQVLERLLNYWHKQLGDEVPMLKLPTKLPADDVDAFFPTSHPISIPRLVADSLHALGQEGGATLFMVLLAALATLLFRYTSQEVILVCSPIANRNHTEIEELIGCFINTLILRVDLSDNPSFRTLLRRVRKTAIDAYAHQDLPFGKLVETLRPDRPLARTPIAQVMLILQNTPNTELELPGLVTQPLFSSNGATTFDLTFDLSETPKGLDGYVEFNSVLFDDKIISQMCEHFLVLLEGIVANPDRCIVDLPLLSNTELHLLLQEWNSTQLPYPEDWCLHDLFALQVRKRPESTALIFNDRQFSYRELNLQANQLANCLQARGIGPETTVAICASRSPKMVIGLLAILKAGGAYVPLDPTYPKDRFAHILEDSSPAVLLTENRWAETLSEYGIPMICLDTDWPVIADEGTHCPDSKVTADSPAYIIYTSGSTGIPKGVVGLHRGAVNRFNWMWKTYPFQAGEVCCQKTSLGFVDSVWEILGPLLRGVPLVIIPDFVVKDVNLLIEALAQHSVTRIVLVPSLMRMLMDCCPNMQDRLPKLSLWVVSGESLSSDLVHRFRESMPSKKLLNLYGSSEVSADVTCHDTSCSEEPLVSVPIGRPISNTQLYLLDSHLNLVPIGVPGEICIGGEGLARGYLNRPDLTAEQFIPHPFSSAPGMRLYRTGDLGRYRQSGAIEFLGRIDHQVKMSGIRIEPGEIETMLNEHPLVRESVVILREDTPGNKYLAAYVVPHSPLPPNTDTLRQFLQAKLPEYMVPSAFVFLDTLPLTSSGKISRIELPTPIRISKQQAPVPPSNVIEQTIADIWEQLLGIEDAGIYDDFFRLGGHSLLAIQFLARVNSALQVNVPLHDFLKKPNIARLSKEVIQRQIAQVDSNALEQLLLEIQSLTEDEVIELLAIEKNRKEENSDG